MTDGIFSIVNNEMFEGAFKKNNQERQHNLPENQSLELEIKNAFAKKILQLENSATNVAKDIISAKDKINQTLGKKPSQKLNEDQQSHLNFLEVSMMNLMLHVSSAENHLKLIYGQKRSGEMIGGLILLQIQNYNVDMEVLIKIG